MLNSRIFQGRGKKCPELGWIIRVHPATGKFIRPLMDRHELLFSAALTALYYDRFLKPNIPMIPEPRSQTAPGMGTTLMLTLSNHTVAYEYPVL